VTDDLFTAIEEPPEPERGPIYPGTMEHLARLMDCNVVAEDHADLWCRLVPDHADLYLEELDVLQEGNSPPWMVDDSSFCLQDVVTPDSRYERVDGLELRCGWTRWALEHGVAPGQPFLLRVHATEGSSSFNGETTEYDSWNDWELLRVRPWPARKVLRSWTRWLADRVHGARMAEAHRPRRFEQAQLGPGDGCFEVHGQPYFAPGQNSSDDMEMPLGYRLSLRYRNRGWWETLATGSSDSGSQEEAVRALLANCVRLPYLRLSPEEIQALPRRW
jgi:hypothetical protein